MRREVVDARPGITLRELIDGLGLKVAESTACRRLIKLGYRCKKDAGGAGAAEAGRRPPPRAVRHRPPAGRAAPLRLPGRERREDGHDPPRHGRSQGGTRRVGFESGGQWRTYTMLAAIRAGGVVRGASLVGPGAMDGGLFLDRVRRRLRPTLSAGDVVVMDNLGSHKVAGVEQAVEAAGASVWYLPPYSPDLNPIEKAWSKVKAHLRRVSARTEEALYAAVGAALDSVTSADCLAYVRSCGYGT